VKIGFLALALAACPSPAAPSVTITPPPSAQPVASTPPPVAPAAGDLPSSLQCAQGDLGAPIPNGRSGVAPEKPTAGQMTEQSAQAKRLFDGEHWAEAAVALEAIANGQSGDDEGNKQIAEYHRAIALYRAKRSSESYAAFHRIAQNLGHVKHTETLLWIAKFVTDEPALVHLQDFSFYTKDDVDRFHNAEQSDLWAMLVYLLGRERLQEGAKAEARQLFAAVPTSHPFARYAKKCLE
jgi:hypothetical protein